MATTTKLSGHSIHSALIFLPLGLLSTGVVFDFIHLLGGSAGFSRVSYYMILGGLISGVVTAVFGWIDLLAIAARTRALKIGVVHGLVNAIMLTLYGASLCVRSNDPGQPEILATMFSTVGTGFALIGCCLGGELMERLSDPNHAGERIDAPISLSLSHAVHPQLHHRGSAIAVRR